MKHKILVTSALPYANGLFHLGHMVEFIQTDIFVRYLRLKGKDVIYCCADDTHGTPIELKAKELNITPEKLIDNFYHEHLKDLKQFNINCDNYYSTNSPENKAFSEYIFNKAKEKGHIYQKEVEQFYCNTCNRFLPDRFIKGTCPKCKAEDQYGDVCESCSTSYKTTDVINPYCSICKSKDAPLELKKSLHYFFKLQDFRQKLNKYIVTSNFQQQVVNFLMNWLDNLEDWCISRDGPYFGFKIPGEEDKYFYVWLDAPIGYIASTANYCQNNKLDVYDYWKLETSEIIHFIGKDIIYFHFLFWPALLMCADFSLPKQIRVHGFLTINGEKMSKSRGTFVTARQYLEHLHPEFFRFYVASNLTSAVEDINLDLQDFKDKINNELIANIGNFCYRTISFVNNNFKGELSTIGTLYNEAQYKAEIEKKIAAIDKHYEKGDSREVMKELLAISTLGNKYVQDCQPWQLIKGDKQEKEKAQQVMTFAVIILKNISILLQPILPAAADKLQQQINLKNNSSSWNNLDFSVYTTQINKGEPLFKKLEDEPADLIPKKIQFEIRVAQIKEVQQHPNADRLYHLKIDLGNEHGEMRELVAGLKEHYTPDQLLNKQVLMLCNLEPADIRGIKSNGMILVTAKGKKIKLIEVPDHKLGELVYTTHKENSFTQLSYNDFKKIKIATRNKHIFYEDKPLKTDSGKINHDFEDNGIVQ
ncbi:methionine--tRNA ligase [Candidatus Woesearchaeota archaeon]|nr:methionine--tRNA ligase [Candidatus Woesearchaeota archaeon]